ncbi:ECF transporter S component [Ureibacillus manganicus]|uniref:Membrane protein n=1 Tax=Ureibacillus manganicus DSM 26584 TaxID=1384049 RepID=A0A0A3IS29_9BACL|nr:ECF transporter S component [Ureibacillus manganicus]KGR77637.1 membrane protein [Ureibacillus manganicus DSM 26584]
MNNVIRNIVFTSLCIAIGLLLPQFIKIIPVMNIGAVLLPMHIPVLICGILCGWRFGVICGATLPILAYVLTGMPPIFPIGISMMFELATYGLLTGLLYELTKGKIYISLIGAMIGGRLVMGIANTILFNFAGNAFGWMAFISSAFITALPGIIIQLIIIPVIIMALQRNLVWKQATQY